MLTRVKLHNYDLGREITSSKKNHETQFLTNSISNDEILKKNQF
jgi:hypothetical protein